MTFCDTTTVYGAVQKHHSEQLGLFIGVPCKEQRIGLIREF